MKTKYLFFSVLFVFIVWGIVACKDDDGLDMPVELTIGGNQTTFEFPAMGGEQKLAMKSNYPWGAEMSPLEDSVWCKLKVSEKSGYISALFPGENFFRGRGKYENFVPGCGPKGRR